MKKNLAPFLMIFVLVGSSHLARGEGPQSVLATYVTRLQDALNQGTEPYLKMRAQVLDEMLRQGEGSAWQTLRSLDQQVLVDHLQKVSNMLWLLPEGHPGRNLKVQFEEALRKNQVPLDWMQESFYGIPSQFGRGVFDPDTHQISLSVRPDNELLLVLTHELTHFFDNDLVKIDDANKINKILITREEAIPTVDREFVARYYFLETYKNSYLSEVEPRVNACLVYQSLVNQKYLVPSDFDRLHYAPILTGQQTCLSQALEELRKQFGEPQFFWSGHRWEASAVQDYYSHWLFTKLGLRSPP